jgi:FAS-associated factor 2
MLTLNQLMAFLPSPRPVSRLLPPTSYPSFTFIAPLSPPPHIAPPKLSILARLESSSTTPESLLQTLHNTVLPLAQPTFNALRREERLRAEERRLREEQDRAFREAERSDLERILKAREEREGEERRQREESRKREEAVERERRREAWLRYGKSAILGDQAGGSEEEGGVYVTLRFTKGDQRAHHRRRFPSSTPIQHLYLWAATISLPSDDSDGRPSSPPSLAPPGTERWTEPEGGWGFRLATSYPRRVLDVEGVDGEECVGESKTLKEGAGVLVFESVQEGRKEGEEDGSSEEETSGDEDDEDEEGASA